MNGIYLIEKNEKFHLIKKVELKKINFFFSFCIFKI